MKVHIIPCLKDNYSYIIHDESNDYACVVDPGEGNPIIDFIKKKNIKLKKKDELKLNLSKKSYAYSEKDFYEKLNYLTKKKYNIKKNKRNY